MKYDIIVLGSGPAGLSAAVTARGRNKSVLVIGNRWQDSPLARAERVDNYLGMPGMTGMEMLEAFQRHAQEMGGGRWSPERCSPLWSGRGSTSRWAARSMRALP